MVGWLLQRKCTKGMERRQPEKSVRRSERCDCGGLAGPDGETPAATGSVDRRGKSTSTARPAVTTNGERENALKLELSTEEIRAILTAHLRAQGIPIELDAKVEFVASDWGGDDELKIEILTATYEILQTSPGTGDPERDPASCRAS